MTTKPNAVLVQVPGQPQREAAWWGPKDDRALLQGYHKHGGILWAHKAITAAVDSILSDEDLDFTVKVTILAVTATSTTTATVCDHLITPVAVNGIATQAKLWLVLTAS